MQVQCGINLSEEECVQLARILNCEPQHLASRLAPYASASLEEYVRMFLGQKVFTRGSDFREYRLLLLIEHAFDHEIPDEQAICSRFQTTVTQARSLVRSVMSKYQYELSNAIDRSLRKVLAASVHSEEEEGYLITVDSESIIHALNRVLASIDGTLPPIVRRRNTVSTYIVKPSSRECLADHLGAALDGEG